MDTVSTLVGHNNPPDPIEQLLTSLRETHEASMDRSAEIASWLEKAPASCDDDDTAAKFSDAIKSCMAFAKNTDAARVSAKEPHLAAGRAVDGFFKKLIDPVDRVKATLAQRLTAYQRKKADEERRERERLAEIERQRKIEEERAAREAARLAREAEEAARAAEAAASAEATAARETADAAAAAAREARDRAAVAKQDANVAKSNAGAKAADLTRARTDLGSVASLRTTWAFEVEDAEQVPRLYLSVNEGAIRAAIRSATTKAGKCPLKIPGVRIYEKQESVVR